jgi:hypothetical protein
MVTNTITARAAFVGPCSCYGHHGEQQRQGCPHHHCFVLHFHVVRLLVCGRCARPVVKNLLQIYTFFWDFTNFLPKKQLFCEGEVLNSFLLKRMILIIDKNSPSD